MLSPWKSCLLSERGKSTVRPIPSRLSRPQNTRVAWGDGGGVCKFSLSFSLYLPLLPSFLLFIYQFLFCCCCCFLSALYFFSRFSSSLCFSCFFFNFLLFIKTKSLHNVLHSSLTLQMKVCSNDFTVSCALLLEPTNKNMHYKLLKRSHLRSFQREQATQKKKMLNQK